MGVWRLCPQWATGTMLLVRGWGAKAPEA